MVPGGQIIDLPVHPLREKYSAFPKPQISSKTLAIHPTEGRIAIVTDAGLDAVDAAALLTNSACRGRQSRVVLAPRRWRQVGGRYPADDGGKKARSPGRARYKP